MAESGSISYFLRKSYELVEPKTCEVGTNKIDWSLKNMANKLAYYHKDVQLDSGSFERRRNKKEREKKRNFWSGLQ